MKINSNFKIQEIMKQQLSLIAMSKHLDYADVCRIALSEYVKKEHNTDDILDVLDDRGMKIDHDDFSINLIGFPDRIANKTYLKRISKNYVGENIDIVDPMMNSDFPSYLDGGCYDDHTYCSISDCYDDESGNKVYVMESMFSTNTISFTTDKYDEILSIK